MNVSLEGQVAVVTGASQGIGLACAKALSTAGAHVVLVSRSAGRLEEAAGSLPGRTAVLPADVGDPATGGVAVALALERFGRLDLVLPNAGVYVGGSLSTRRPSTPSRPSSTASAASSPEPGSGWARSLPESC